MAGGGKEAYVGEKVPVWILSGMQMDDSWGLRLQRNAGGETYTVLKSVDIILSGKKNHQGFLRRGES